ncbi:hypothetical protein E2P81_ATG02671 [Venturia nashicola]|nr:hypothetical protein E2P81_ATG02671 [Venturia nashicola]
MTSKSRVPITIQSGNIDRKIAAGPANSIFAPQNVAKPRRQHMETTSPGSSITFDRVKNIVGDSQEGLPILELESISILFSTTTTPQRHLTHQSLRVRMESNRNGTIPEPSLLSHQQYIIVSRTSSVSIKKPHYRSIIDQRRSYSGQQ